VHVGCAAGPHDAHDTAIEFVLRADHNNRQLAFIHAVSDILAVRAPAERRVVCLVHL
jgi:hypothetical protein